MKKMAFIIMIITVISKFTGFGRELTLSYIYGASNISDAYLISTTIPKVIFGFVAAGLTAGYIPIYSKVVQNTGVIEANRFTNNLINILLVISTGIILIGLIYTKGIVRVFASGFEGENLALTVQFTRISLLGLYCTGIISIFTGYLQIKNKYILPALIGLPLNFIIIVSMILSAKIHVIVLPIGFVVASISQVMLMLPSMKKNAYKYKWVLDIKEKNVVDMAYIVAPVILGISVNQINVLVDRTIASRIVVGGISVLNYANRLNSFVLGIFVLSIVTVLYPQISKMAAEDNMMGLKNSLSEAITGINLLVLPAMVGTMIFANPIVSLLFARGAFDVNATVLTSSALFFYSIGMIGFGLREVLTRAFYSVQDTKTPMINATIGVIINIVLNLILSQYMGINGLALATSLSAIVTSVLLFIKLREKIGSFGIKKIIISFIKILSASLIMGMIAKQSFNFTLNRFDANIGLVLAIAIGVISYFIVIYFMKIEDVEVIVSSIKSKFKVKK